MKLNTVGIALSYYREKYGLSMTQVCEGICSPATMFRIEEGYREVDSLVSATLLSRIGKQVLEFELLLNEKDYNLFRLRKDIHRNLEEKNLDLKQVSGKISYGKWEISYRIFEKEECRC